MKGSLRRICLAAAVACIAFGGGNTVASTFDTSWNSDREHFDADYFTQRFKEIKPDNLLPEEQVNVEYGVFETVSCLPLNDYGAPVWNNILSYLQQRADETAERSREANAKAIAARKRIEKAWEEAPYPRSPINYEAEGRFIRDEHEKVIGGLVPEARAAEEAAKRAQYLLDGWKEAYGEREQTPDRCFRRAAPRVFLGRRGIHADIEHENVSRPYSEYIDALLSVLYEAIGTDLEGDNGLLALVFRDGVAVELGPEGVYKGLLPAWRDALGVGYKLPE